MDQALEFDERDREELDSMRSPEVRDRALQFLEAVKASFLAAHTHQELKRTDETIGDQVEGFFRDQHAKQRVESVITGLLARRGQQIERATKK